MLKKSIYTFIAIATLGVSCNSTDEPIKIESFNDSLSYALGVNIANNLRSNKIDSLKPQIFAKALQDFYDSSQVLTNEEAQQVIQSFMAKMQEAEKAKQAAEAELSKSAGLKFLEENGKREGVTTTASGLQYEVITMGKGAKPAATDEVKVHYHGTLTDGRVFDSSVDRGEPISFPLNGVIAGWTEGVQLMPIGSKFKFYIPSELGYGDRGAGEMIGPGSTLIFEVELLDIVKK